MPAVPAANAHDSAPWLAFPVRLTAVFQAGVRTDRKPGHMAAVRHPVLASARPGLCDTTQSQLSIPAPAARIRKRDTRRRHRPDLGAANKGSSASATSAPSNDGQGWMVYAVDALEPARG